MASPGEPLIPLDPSFLALGDVAPFDRAPLFDALIRQGGWIQAVRALVQAADLETLDQLATGTCPVLDLVRHQYHVPLGHAAIGGDLPPERGAHDLERACRAAAALGGVVLDPTRVDLRDQAVSWYRRAPVPVDHQPIEDVFTRATDLPFLEVLRDGGSGLPFAVAFAGYLAGNVLTPGSRARVSVLFDAGTEGQAGWLHLVSTRDLKPILLPDPASMALFRGDDRFHASLRRSWALRPAKHGVLWSIEGSAGTIDAVSGGSLGAAFAIALDEIHALDRVGRRLVRLRRLGSPSVAVTGDVGATGRLVAVGGLDAKIAAAAASPNIRRVVIPAVTTDAAPDVTVSGDASVEVIPVQDLDAVLHVVRRVDRRAVARTSMVVLTAVALVLGSVAFSAVRSRSAAETTAASLKRQNHKASLVALADRLAKHAIDGASRSPNGDSLLLAMVADDVYSAAGRTHNTLAEVQGQARAPVRILRPDHGDYVDAVASQSGRYVLAWSDSGSATITDVLTGSEVWNKAFPPGVELDPSQIRFTAAASNPRSDLFAVALSTREVLMLVPQEGSVWPAEPVPLNIPSRRELGLTELNTLDDLSFRPDGTTLVGFGVGTGTFEFDLGRDTHGPDRTCGASDAFKPVSIAATQDGGVLGVTEDGAILRQDLTTCAIYEVRSAPEHLKAASIAVTDSPDAFGLVVAGTSGNDLVVSDAKGLRTVIGTQGPYRDVALSPDGAEVSATNPTGPLAWDVDGGNQLAHWPGDGLMRAEGQAYEWVHGGIVEVYRRGIDFSAAMSIRASAIDAAIGGDRLLAANFAHVFALELSKDPGSVGAELPAPRLPGTVDAIKPVALSSSGRTGLAVPFDRKAGVRTLVVWDVDSGKVMSLPAVPGDVSVNDVRFVGGRDDEILVGYRSGRLDLLSRPSRASLAWKRRDALNFDHAVFSLDVTRGGDRAVVLSSGGQGNGPVVSSVEITRSGLRERVVHNLDAQSGDRGFVSLLPDGSSIVAMTGGELLRLTPSLATKRTGHVDLGGILVATPVPGRTSMILAGLREAVLISTKTLRIVSGPPEAGPFGWVSSARPSGVFLVTTHVLAAEPRVTVWNLGRKGTRAQACQAVGRDFTEGEWKRWVGTALPFRPPCRRYLKDGSSLPSIGSVPAKEAPLLVPDSGACPSGESVGGFDKLRLVRPAPTSVVACSGDRRVAKLVGSYGGKVLDPMSARVVTLGDDQAGWYLSVVGRDSGGSLVTVVGVEHGTDTLAFKEVNGVVKRTVVRPPHSPNSVPLVGLVAPDDTITTFLPRVERVVGSSPSAELVGGFTWPAQVES